MKGIIDVFILSSSKSTEDLVPSPPSEDTNDGGVFDEGKGGTPSEDVNDEGTDIILREDVASLCKHISISSNALLAD